MAVFRSSRVLARAFHTTRVTRGGHGGAPWGTEVNEPGGRLFGEPIRKPGERRKLHDWEVPYLGTMFIASIMLVLGLNSKPESSGRKLIQEEAERRVAALGLDDDE